MRFFVSCQDRPNSAQLRKRLRPDHLAYMIAARHDLVFGGPVMDDDMERTLGSMFVIEKPDRQAVDAFLANEPYFRNGLFESVVVRVVNVMVPEAFPGALELELEKETSL